MVTYNTLIDVYGKSGQWEEALEGECALARGWKVLSAWLAGWVEYMGD